MKELIEESDILGPLILKDSKSGSEDKYDQMEFSAKNNDQGTSKTDDDNVSPSESDSYTIGVQVEDVQMEPSDTSNIQEDSNADEYLMDTSESESDAHEVTEGEQDGKTSKLLEMRNSEAEVAGEKKRKISLDEASDEAQDTAKDRESSCGSETESIVIVKIDEEVLGTAKSQEVGSSKKAKALEEQSQGLITVGDVEMRTCQYCDRLVKAFVACPNGCEYKYGDNDNGLSSFGQLCAAANASMDKKIPLGSSES